jgi:hypothetical protein
MKYYKIQIKLFYPNNRIASTAVGDNIPDIEFYLKKIRGGEIIMDTPLFDSFHLESYDRKKYWEWQLFDVYHLRGAGIHIPSWFISENTKNLLENFSLSCPYNFYPCKLLYKNKKLDYFIFQFAGQIIIDIIRTKYIKWNQSVFINPIDESYMSINSMSEFIDISRHIRKISEYEKEIKLQKLVLKDNIDFFPMGTYLNDDLVSERLKQAIETMGITGFEFSELDYDVVIEEG